jgi:hypothetical protein
MDVLQDDGQTEAALALKTPSLAVLDKQVGDSLVATGLARGLRWSQPSSAPRNHAGPSQSLDTFAKRLRFSRAGWFLSHRFVVSARRSSAARLVLLCEVVDRAARRWTANELSNTRRLSCADASHLRQRGGVYGDDPLD